MSETRKGRVIEKWDEVNGQTTETDPMAIDSPEDTGAGPSISRNYMRGVEDMVEQNDNSFDGVINNVPKTEAPEETIAEKEEKTSVVEKLKKHVSEEQDKIRDRVAVPVICCPEPERC